MEIGINKYMYDKLLPFNDERILFKAYVSDYRMVKAFKGHNAKTTLEQLYCFVNNKWYSIHKNSNNIDYWYAAQCFYDYVGKTVLFNARVKIYVSSEYNYDTHKKYLISHIDLLYPSKLEVLSDG